jgi:anthranilate phosphoribosyltransferase
MIEQAIRKISERMDLSQEETFETVNEIFSGQASEAQIAGFLIGLRVKGETADEITGGVNSLMAAAVRINPDVPGCVDPVGTGGDKTGTFNISSTAALVACGAGANVAKHGNRSVSSRSGSADLFEALGLDLSLTPDEARQCLEQTGFTFLFAPVYHPAMKYAAPVRRQLGVRSLFNLLGSLANPAGARSMLVGLCEPALLPYMAQTLSALGVQRAMVVSGRDHADEISLSAPTDYFELDDGRITRGVLSPEQFGLPRASLDEVKGGTPDENARIVEAILAGQLGAPRNIVLLNAAATLYVAGLTSSMAEGMKMARRSIDTGEAYQKLQELRRFHRRVREGRPS